MCSWCTGTEVRHDRNRAHARAHAHTLSQVAGRAKTTPGEGAPLPTAHVLELKLMGMHKLHKELREILRRLSEKNRLPGMPRAGTPSSPTSSSSSAGGGAAAASPSTIDVTPATPASSPAPTETTTTTDAPETHQCFIDDMTQLSRTIAAMQPAGGGGGGGADGGGAGGHGGAAAPAGSGSGVVGGDAGGGSDPVAAASQGQKEAHHDIAPGALIYFARLVSVICSNHRSVRKYSQPSSVRYTNIANVTIHRSMISCGHSLPTNPP